jgi:hypothetical protein
MKTQLPIGTLFRTTRGAELPVLTDRAPFEFVYLSRRLLMGLIQQDEAARPRSRRTFGVNPPWLGFSTQRRAPDYSNLRDLAMRSVDAVSDHTGGLDNTWSPYVHGIADFRWGVFSPHMGWTGGEVACFHGSAIAPDGIPVRLAFFGSASNLVGRVPGSEVDHGFYPSDMLGLYALLDSVREPNDPEIDLTHRVDDLSLGRDRLIEQALEFADGGAHFGPRTLEFLVLRQLSADGDDLDPPVSNATRVLVGAPLWVATPKPQPAPGGLPPK